MKEGWSNRWKRLLIWVSGYLSIIAYVIVGGYFFTKTDDEDLKKTAKSAFIVTIIFTAISAFLGIYSACLSLADSSYSTTAYDAYSWMTNLTLIAKTVTFVVCALVSFFRDKINDNKNTKSKVVVEEEKYHSDNEEN